jgi:hypothetical protein
MKSAWAVGNITEEFLKTSKQLIDDHCPDIYNDKEFPGNLDVYRSRIFTQGYTQALLDSMK